MYGKYWSQRTRKRPLLAVRHSEGKSETDKTDTTDIGLVDSTSQASNTSDHDVVMSVTNQNLEIGSKTDTTDTTDMVYPNIVDPPSHISLATITSLVKVKVNS